MSALQHYAGSLEQIGEADSFGHADKDGPVSLEAFGTGYGYGRDGPGGCGGAGIFRR